MTVNSDFFKRSTYLTRKITSPLPGVYTGIMEIEFIATLILVPTFLELRNAGGGVVRVT